MPTDSVVAEVRAAREAYAARFGFDPVAMARDLRERERTTGRVIIPPPAAAGGRGVEAESSNQARASDLVRMAAFRE
jgi:hypothetical protein